MQALRRAPVSQRAVASAPPAHLITPFKAEKWLWDSARSQYRSRQHLNTGATPVGEKKAEKNTLPAPSPPHSSGHSSSSPSSSSSEEDTQKTAQPKCAGACNTSGSSPLPEKGEDKKGEKGKSCFLVLGLFILLSSVCLSWSRPLHRERTRMFSLQQANRTTEMHAFMSSFLKGSEDPQNMSVAQLKNAIQPLQIVGVQLSNLIDYVHTEALKRYKDKKEKWYLKLQAKQGRKFDPS
jgi:hypothetical protein